MAFSSMIGRPFIVGVWLWLALAGGAVAQTGGLDFVYLYRADDAAYEEQRAYARLLLAERRRPLEGAKLAIRDSRMIASALGLAFDLVEREVAVAMSAVEAIAAARAGTGASIFLLDLPEEDLIAAARHFRDAPGLILLNVRHGDDRLRGEACSAALFHVVPSDAMRADALAQYLSKRNWRRVLVLAGEAARDAVIADAFAASARKFGLDIVDRRAFVLSNDPRLREQNNTLLLTGGAAYDVVFLADSDGEFGRYVPFATYLPRPVVGSEGLIASAWHWTFERYGAPQLNQRFDKLAGRRMSDADWAGWAAVRSVVEAVVRAKTGDGARLRSFLTDDAFTFDMYKGAPGNFRTWDRQLRQPILLHTERAVIVTAPVEGFLHQKNTLDSLGTDAPESRCATGL
jgi:ABC transporter substrate binding protein (PQQ-dependent alcohol dehydrogenase system)